MMFFKVIFCVLTVVVWCYCWVAIGFDMCKNGWYKPFVRHKIKKKKNKKEELNNG